MKNIDKYTNTKDALEAYQAREMGAFTTFREWCDREYEEPKPLTLLEAAKDIELCIRGTPFAVRWSRSSEMLTDAIKFEETRPKRNYERFGTAQKAILFFRMRCKMYGDCDYCPMINTYRNPGNLGRMSCFAEWLYSTEDVFKKGSEQ